MTPLNKNILATLVVPPDIDISIFLMFNLTFFNLVFAVNILKSSLLVLLDEKGFSVLSISDDFIEIGASGLRFGQGEIMLCKFC